MPAFRRYRSRRFYRRQYGLRSRRFRRYRQGLRRRNRYTGGRVVRNIMQNVYSDKKVVKLRYSGMYTVTGTAGTFGTKVFNINNLYSPDPSVPTAQPRGFDNMSGIYSKYCVIGVKASARFNVGSNSGFVVGSLVSLASTPPVTLTYRELLENPDYVTGWTGADINKGTNTFTRAINPNKYLDIKDPIGPDSTVSAATSAGPANPVYLQWSYTAANPSEALAANVVYTLDFIAVFYNPYNLNPS